MKTLNIVLMQTLFLFSIALNSNASTSVDVPVVHKFECQTPHQEKIVQINLGNKLDISFEENVGRKISSVRKSGKTVYSSTGLTKIFFEGSTEVKLHIQNFTAFSEIEDYLSYTSDKGHRMTYPLTCSRI